MSALPQRPHLPLSRFPIGSLVLAVVLVLIGVSLVVAGIVVRDVPMAVAGGIVCLPGTYMLWVFFQLWRGNPRYRATDYFSNVFDPENSGSGDDGAGEAIGAVI